MALRSERQESVVDPDQGVYVEMPGIMEVRFAKDDQYVDEEAEDFYDFQQRVKEISEDFCHKDKYHNEQYVFFCLVCNCDLKSLRPLRDHVTGNRHIRKALEKKRQIMGMPVDPQNQPRTKKVKKEKPKVDIGKSLRERLEDCGEPAIGLGFITEFLNPDNLREPPMYSCKLAGCKSAWGTSDDMFNHVIKTKHQKNFFKLQNPDDFRIAGLSNNDILIKASEYEEELGGMDSRDYHAIVQVRDLNKYLEIKNRPINWSEKKDENYSAMDVDNPNTMPLGQRRSGGWNNNIPEPEESLFDEEAWKDWKPRSYEESVSEFNKNVQGGLEDLQEMIQDFDGTIGDEKHEDIQFYSNLYGNLLEIMEKDSSEVCRFKGDLARLNDNLSDKTEGEDRRMKEVSKLMAELEDEVEKYHSDRDSKKYENVKTRLSEVTKKNKLLKPIRAANIKLKKDYNARLSELWTEFEKRSDSLSDILQKNSSKNPSEKRLVDRKQAEQRFSKEMTDYACAHISRHYSRKFPNEVALRKFAEDKVASKILPKEVTNWAMSGQPWVMFHVSEQTKKQVEKYLAVRVADMPNVN